MLSLSLYLLLAVVVCSAWNSPCAGGDTAAFVEGVILQPTLYWKNARAQKLPFTLNPRLLYRGTAASIFNEMQMMGVQFGLTGWFEKLFDSSTGVAHDSAAASTSLDTNTFVSACLGGMFSAVFSSPIELIMIQQQKHGGTFLRTPVHVIKQHGIFSHGIFRGVTAAASRDTIYTCGMLGVTPRLQSYLQDKYELSQSSASFYASMIGGVAAAVPSHPFDVIKTCMQGDLSQASYTSFTGTLKKLLSEGGLPRLFNGVFWRTVNITATVYIANECRNFLTPYIQKVDI